MTWIRNTIDVYFEWLLDIGVKTSAAYFIQEISLFFISLFLFFLIDKAFTFLMSKYIHWLIRKSKTIIDDTLFDNKVFAYFLRLVSVIILITLVDNIFIEYVLLGNFVALLLKLYIVYLVLRGVLAILKSVNQIYERQQKDIKRSIKSYVQVFQLLAIFIAILVGVSIVVSRDITVLLTSLGAFAAVLMLIFKDTILGFVGGIQINANDMLRPGDWISVPRYGADGTVIDISLTTVKIQNWDKTITTIPTYSLVTDSFHNWRGMEESGGRRIKRSVNIDVQSIRFCSEEQVNKYKKIELLKDYMTMKEAELVEYNKDRNISESALNGRQQTNVGVFRNYIAEYLRSMKEINPDMTFLVRQLQPTEKGLPIEIYVFSKVQEWSHYEAIQADIFDHIFAVIPEFSLKAFQNPSGADFVNVLKS